MRYIMNVYAIRTNSIKPALNNKKEITDISR